MTLRRPSMLLALLSVACFAACASQGAGFGDDDGSDDDEEEQTGSDAASLDALMNDDDDNFCPATSAISGSTDKGSPGAANDPCP